MAAYKITERENISKSHSTPTKPKVSAKAIQNRIIGIILIVLGVITMFIPSDTGEADGTAFVMLLIIGSIAVFSKE